jgi:uncharacterized protein with FMN-binding domain
MRRIVMWFLSTVTIVVLLFGYHTSTSGPSSASEQVISSGSSSGGGSTGTSSTTSGSSSGASSGASSGTVTGPAVDTRWGPVQVEITTSGGKISDVEVVEYPDNNPRDQEINSYALPILVQETLDAQGADIDMVSGATVTSGGYVQSLQAALDQAGL